MADRKRDRGAVSATGPRCQEAPRNATIGRIGHAEGVQSGRGCRVTPALLTTGAPCASCEERTSRAQRRRAERAREGRAQGRPGGVAPSSTSDVGRVDEVSMIPLKVPAASQVRSMLQRVQARAGSADPDPPAPHACPRPVRPRSRPRVIGARYRLLPRGCVSLRASRRPGDQPRGLAPRRRSRRDRRRGGGASRARVAIKA